MEALLTPFDAVRAASLRLFGAYGRRFLVRREERVMLYALLGLAMALGMTCAAPVLLYALGPIVLGVPHLVSDVRYLVARPGLHRRVGLALLTGLPLAATWIWPSPAVGLLAGFGPLVCARAPKAVRTALVLTWTAIYLVATRSSYVTTLLLVHGHNLVAVALFAVVFARRRGSSWVLVVAFIALSAALVGGAFDGILLRPHALEGPASALGIRAIVRSIAPVSDPVLGVRLVAFFVFAQSVHYVVWLRLVPEEARERPGLRSFTSSFRALAADLGKPVLYGALFVGLAIGAYAFSSVEKARVLYLHVAAFHTYLEIAAMLLLIAERSNAFAKRELGPP